MIPYTCGLSRVCDDIGSWNYNRLKLEFHQKFYPMHLVHRDRNYIYDFWPREGERIAEAWGRLKSMLYSCPNHELPREIIIQNFYARLSRNDQSMLDTSCADSFMKKMIEFRWDLLERINTTLKIGNSTKVKSQVLELNMIVLNLVWIPMLFKSLALNMDLILR